MDNENLVVLSKKDLALIRGAIRQAYHMSGHYKAYLLTQRIELPRYKKNEELAKVPHVKYQCNHCKDLFSGSQIDVDHIYDIGSLLDLHDVGSFAIRVFCDYSNLQILCDHCHKEKTAVDRIYSKLEF